MRMEKQGCALPSVCLIIGLFCFLGSLAGGCLVGTAPTEETAPPPEDVEALGEALGGIGAIGFLMILAAPILKLLTYPAEGVGSLLGCAATLAAPIPGIAVVVAACYVSKCSRGVAITFWLLLLGLVALVVLGWLYYLRRSQRD
jgi:hypothetical protein